MAALFAGGGIRGGQVYGQSDRIGGYPVGKPVFPEDIARTIYHALGIDDRLDHTDRDGRRLSLLSDGDILPVF